MLEADAIRVLLLEDSPNDAELIAQQLASSGAYRLDWVGDRATFIAALREHRHDLVVCDYVLPDIDALSALALAREHAPHMPFVFLSGVAGEEVAASAIMAGASDYVLKRNLPRLPGAIERAIAENRAARAQQLEARSRERDRIWRLSRDLFAVTDSICRLIAVNPAWWRILGHQEAHLLESGWRDFVHPDDAARFDAMLPALAQGNPVEHFEVRMRRRDGAFRWISWTAVPQGEENYLVGRDTTEVRQWAAELAHANTQLTAEITERERVEETLRQMQRLEAMGQLTAGVAHDFNNLLAVVLGNISLLERLIRARDDAKEARLAQQIRNAAERGARLITQLLAFSRRQVLEPLPLDLNDTIIGMRELLQSSLGGAIQLSTRPQPDLWRTVADRTQIEMAILNLVINARDAMPGGGTITVCTENHVFTDVSGTHAPTPGEYVLLTVEDTGTGMPEEVLARVFEPFFTTKETGQGSGLGLAQVHSFAARAGGGVRIDTEVGRGTLVGIYLPRAAVAPHDPQELIDPTPSDPAAEPRARILIVDDDAAVRTVTASILTDAGHQVTEADSGRAAVDALRAREFDLLLVDYAMPELNGAATAVAALELQPDLAVLFLTGFSDVSALKDIDKQRLIEKPFQDHELKHRIATVLAARRAPRA